MWGVELIVVAALVAVNAVFAGYELALAAAPAARLRTLAESGRAGAAAALYMKEKLEASLAVVQLGVTLSGAIAAATGGAGAQESVAPWLQVRCALSPGWAQAFAIVVVVLPLSFVSVAFGELVPKVFALRNAEWVCLKFSPVMKWCVRVGRPAVWALEAVARGVVGWHARRWRPAGGELLPEAGELQDLRAIAALARAARLIGRLEEGVILGVAGFPTRPVREIVVPAGDIVTLAADAPLSEALATARRDMHTRFPVTAKPGDPQGIVGYVTFKDLFAHAWSGSPSAAVRETLRPIQKLAGSRPLAECLDALLRARDHIAVIADADGRLLGMITLEDILEELVGDIQDEYDRLPDQTLASGTGWVVGGGISLGRLKELTGVELAGTELVTGPQTLNDWVVTHLGRGARVGETVEGAGLRVTVRAVRRHKVQEAFVSRATSPQAPSAAEPGHVVGT